jgi:hypothetical protein
MICVANILNTIILRFQNCGDLALIFRDVIGGIAWE